MKDSNKIQKILDVVSDKSALYLSELETLNTVDDDMTMEIEIATAQITLLDEVYQDILLIKNS